MESTKMISILDTTCLFLENVGLTPADTADFYFPTSFSYLTATSDVHSAKTNYDSVSEDDFNTVSGALNLVIKKESIEATDDEQEQKVPGVTDDAAKLREMAYVRILRERWDPILRQACHKKAATKVSYKQCANCQKDTDGKWRRDVAGRRLCNACGLYFRSNGCDRPIFTVDRHRHVVKPAPAPRPDGVSCANCLTTRAQKWRKDHPDGSLVCNACGMYYRTHGVTRPFRRGISGDKIAVDLGSEGDGVSPARMETAMSVTEKECLIEKSI